MCLIDLGKKTKNSTQPTDYFLYILLFNTQKMGKSSITCQKAENWEIRFFANKSF